jgi:hypothetical protein
VGSFSSLLLDQHSVSSSCLFTSDDDDDDDDNDIEWRYTVDSSSMATSMDLSTPGYKSCCDDDSSNATDICIGMMTTDNNMSFVSARHEMMDLTEDDVDDVEKQMTQDQQSNKSQPQDMQARRQKPQATGSNKSQRQGHQKHVSWMVPEDSTRTCCMSQRQRRRLLYQLAGLSVIATLMVAILLWGHLEGKNKNSDLNNDNMSGTAAGLLRTNRPSAAPVPSPLDTIMKASAATPSPFYRVSVKLWSNDMFS